MSIRLNANMTIPVRPESYLQGGSVPTTNSNPIEITAKQLLVAAFEAIPSQAGATATVGAIVTALKTLP